MFGNVHGGSAYVDPVSLPKLTKRTCGLFANQDDCSHTLIPPRGYNICGVTGSCGAWVDGFSVIITR